MLHPISQKIEDENSLSTIIDELGALKAEIADLPAREKSMKEALGDLEAGRYEGERYRISISVSTATPRHDRGARTSQPSVHPWPYQDDAVRAYRVSARKTS